jgi:hypothetical protein
MFIGPFGPAAFLRGGGGAVFIDRTWSYFECATGAAWLIEALAVASVALVLLKRTEHVLWCGLAALLICLFVSPYPKVQALLNEMQTVGSYSSSSGLSWGVFVIGLGAVIAGVAGLIESRSVADARRGASAP